MTNEELVGLLQDLSASGTALSSIGLSWCILHNNVFRARDLPLRRALYVWCAMLVLQVIVIVIPNAIKGGAGKYYAPSG
jgi:hypothetical protein